VFQRQRPAVALPIRSSAESQKIPNHINVRKACGFIEKVGQIISLRTQMKSTQNIEIPEDARIFNGRRVAFWIVFKMRVRPRPLCPWVCSDPGYQADSFKIAFGGEISQCSFRLLIQLSGKCRVRFLVFIECPERRSHPIAEGGDERAASDNIGVSIKKEPNDFRVPRPKHVSERHRGCLCPVGH
jgi:hypothetical protein